MPPPKRQSVSRRGFVAAMAAMSAAVGAFALSARAASAAPWSAAAPGESLDSDRSYRQQARRRSGAHSSPQRREHDARPDDLRRLAGHRHPPVRRRRSGSGPRPTSAGASPPRACPRRRPSTDLSQGVPLATMQKLARYWATEYDWRKVEARLNAVPNFITEIDGLDIHFIHVRSKHENALAPLISHGWPGSIIEQLKLIEPLTNPTAHGGSAADAFHVVIPSMPGYGFSGKPTETGWGPERIARAWVVLMKRLGYTSYVAQGGDWGAVVVDLMGVQAPKGLLAIHTNMPGVVPPAIDAAAFAGAPVPAGLSADEKHAYEQLAAFYKNVYYAVLHGHAAADADGLGGFTRRPGHLHDRPRRAQPGADRTQLRRSRRRAHAGRRARQHHAVLADEHGGFRGPSLLGETSSASSAPKGVKIPVAVSAFPDELYQAPRSWAEQAYPNLIHYNQLDQGRPLRGLGAADAAHRGLRAGFEFRGPALKTGR